MGNMTIFTSACVMPGTSVLRDVDRRGLQLAGLARVGGYLPVRSGGARIPAEVHTSRVSARVNAFLVKQLEAPSVVGIDGGVGPHPGRPPI
ncbi:MAG: hypothetical protein GEV11_10140 [Streptosporangiales bacterium]|nr:hypothetical protein [Streptosporangiales bacterium]